MHDNAFRFVAKTARQLGPRRFVLEIGARSVNGSVRPLFEAARYIGIDLSPGPEVDVIADGSSYTPDEPPDTIVCCEVLEHAPNAEEIVRHAARLLAPGGVLIITCATDPRKPHSAVDGGPVHEGEHYRNVAPTDLAEWLRSEGVQVSLDARQPCDLYALATKAS